MGEYKGQEKTGSRPQTHDADASSVLFDGTEALLYIYIYKHTVDIYLYTNPPMEEYALIYICILRLLL